MTRSIFQRAAVATVLAGVLAAPVFAGSDAAYDTYRHTVLGQTQAQAAQQSRFDEFAPRQVASGYERYLLNNGQSAWSAAEQSARIDSVDVALAPRADDSRYTAAQLYQRSIGNNVVPTAATVRASALIRN